MNYTELAAFIRANYIPFAITCDCNGSHPSCASALDDPRVWAQYDTARRIADAIAGMEAI